MKKTLVLGIYLLIITPIKLQGQDSIAKVKNEIFSYEISYIGDVATNFSGGLKTGTVYLGMANVILGFDTEAAKWWKGGTFFINGASIHGQSPSEKLTGDFQVISNIDAGNHIYMHELWYKQSFPKFEFTIGLQDLNVDFASTENGGYFINSSFGIPPVIASNVPAPIFPLTGLGLSFKYSISNHFTFLGAIFDGKPNDFENNKYNLTWSLNKNDGVLAITELQLNTNILGHSGVYKTGYYYHSGLSEKNTETGITDLIFKNNYGFYIIGDQNVWKKEEVNKINLFTQIALSPGEQNNHNYYIGGGIDYLGIFAKSKEDVLGVGFAYAGFHNEMHKHETTIEIFYKTQITKNISLQPDIQYVINPSGFNEEIKNALVGLIRFGVNF